MRIEGHEAQALPLCFSQKLVETRNIGIGSMRPLAQYPMKPGEAEPSSVLVSLSYCPRCWRLGRGAGGRRAWTFAVTGIPPRILLVLLRTIAGDVAPFAARFGIPILHLTAVWFKLGEAFFQHVALGSLCSCYRCTRPSS